MFHSHDEEANHRNSKATSSCSMIGTMTLTLLADLRGNLFRSTVLAAPGARWN